MRDYGVCSCSDPPLQAKSGITNPPGEYFPPRRVAVLPQVGSSPDSRELLLQSLHFPPLRFPDIYIHRNSGSALGKDFLRMQIHKIINTCVHP